MHMLDRLGVGEFVSACPVFPGFLTPSALALALALAPASEDLPLKDVILGVLLTMSEGF